LKLFGKKDIATDEPTSIKEEEIKKDAKFLRDLNKNVYFDSQMGLDERLNRKAHYVDRRSARD
jgi:hypothetical protein